MKRLISFLLALILMGCVFAAAEDADDGDDSNPVPLEAEETEEVEEDADDSNPIPVDMMEDEDLEVEEEINQGRILQYGDNGDDVLALQTRLKDLQYYNGNLSGRFREGTRKAVETFQEDFGLDQTGVADLRTLSILFSMTHRPLRFGSTGSDVKQLQTQLTELGYYKGKISGNYLESTQKAVQQLQKKNGLEVTGIADADLQELIQAGKILNSSDVASDTDTPAPNLANYLVDDNENSVSVPDVPVEYTKKLKSGSKGKLVKEMQTRLAELGYYEGPISGNFQKYTVRAVKAIQTQNGLESTGVVDETTWNVIFNDAHAVLPDATPKPTPSPSPVPFAITVDVANQVTTVYGRDDQGEYTVMAMTMPMMSNSAMKIKSYNMLGQRASHGCIRLSVPDAKWIYDNVGKGTVVSIVEGMEPDPELRDALKLPPLDKKSCTPINTPVPTAEPEYSAAEKPDIGMKVLKVRAEGPEIYWVQRTLKDLGYYTTKCTGKFLARTEKAIKAFQQNHGLKANGGLTQELIDMMAEEALNNNAPETTPDITPEPTETPVS